MKNLSELSTMALLEALLFDEDSVVLVSPNEPVPAGHTTHCTLQSGIARRMFSGANVLIELANKESDEHAALHMADGRNHRDHDCAKHHERQDMMDERVHILQTLFWQALLEEVPAASTNGVKINRDWAVSSEGPWKEEVLFGKDDLASRFIARLKDVLRGAVASSGAGPQEPVAEGETVLGTMDGKFLAFGSLSEEIKTAHDTALPTEYLLGSNKYLEALPAKEKARMDQIHSIYASLNKAVQAVFWRAIRESVPGAAEADGIGVRAGGQIVSLPAEKKPKMMDDVQVIDLTPEQLMDLLGARRGARSARTPVEMS